MSGRPPHRRVESGWSRSSGGRGHELRTPTALEAPPGVVENGGDVADAEAEAEVEGKSCVGEPMRWVESSVNDVACDERALSCVGADREKGSSR